MGNIFSIPISPIAVGGVFTAILILCLFLSNKRKDKHINNQFVITKKESIQEAITENDQITPEILAVIAAAVASVMQTSNSYQIKTIKRVDNNPNWKMISRFEQTYTKN